MNKLALFGVLALALICGVSAHSYVTSPTTRSDQGSAQRGCRGPECLGPCDAPASQKRTPIVVKRGDALNIVWPRNNHAAGFIRFAWAPTANSDSHAAFDSNVQQVTCHEVGGCKPDRAEDPNGGDTGSMCSTSFKVPRNLADGEWTLQWAWFGGAFSLGDYYSCVDYKVSGGVAVGSINSTFFGGDYANPGKPVCKFFSTDRLHKCINEPCNAPIYSGEQNGKPFGFDSGATPIPVTPVPSTTTGVKVPVPSTTTGVQVPTPTPTPTDKCTTGSYQCVGSSSPAYRICNAVGTWIDLACGAGTVCKQNGNTIACELGTATPTPAATTGVSVPAPTPTPTPTPTPSANNSCPADGLGRCSEHSNNKFYVCDGRTMKWATAQYCPTGLVCTISENPSSKGKAYCVRPGESVREGESNGANNLFVNSLWIALVLVSVCVLNF